MAAAFAKNKVPGGPFPQQLAGAAGLRWYREYAKQHVLTTDHNGRKLTEFDREVRTAIQYAVLMSLQYCYGYRDCMLNDTSDYLYAFIRVVLNPKDAEIVKKHGKEAYIQVTQNPKLLESLKASGYDLSWMEAFI